MKPVCFCFSLALISLSASRVEATLFQQAYVKASNPQYIANFGRTVALSGDTMVVGAPYENSSATGINGDQSNTNSTFSGAVYVYVRNGSSWTQQAYVKPSNTGSNDTFGFSVAISGDTMVVGSPQESSIASGVGGNQADNSSTNSGAVYVFIRSGTSWTQQAYIKASNSRSQAQFGYSVAISGDTMIAGAPLESSSATGVDGNQADSSLETAGAAYVFTRSGTFWGQQAYLKASNTGSNDAFGVSVSISSNTVAVGALGEASNSTVVNGNQLDNSAPYAGAAYVFVRNGTTWNQQTYLKAANAEANDLFGLSVSLDADTLAVGAIQEDGSSVGINGNAATNGAPDSGAAYVFVRNGSSWSQQAYVKPSNTHSNNLFGFSVALQSDTMMVGSPREPNDATGFNGNQTNTLAVSSGAAYLFRRNGTSWSQATYIKASNTGAGDEFGYAVAISAATFAIGALSESSSSSGINGNQNNDSLSQSGAAYVFVDLEGSTGPALNIVPAGYFLRFNGLPNVSYDIQRAPTVNGPWSTIATVVAPASGFIEYHETNPPPGQSYYRTLQ